MFGTLKDSIALRDCLDKLVIKKCLVHTIERYYLIYLNLNCMIVETDIASSNLNLFRACHVNGLI